MPQNDEEELTGLKKQPYYEIAERTIAEVAQSRDELLINIGINQLATLLMQAPEFGSKYAMPVLDQRTAMEGGKIESNKVQERINNDMPAFIQLAKKLVKNKNDPGNERSKFNLLDFQNLIKQKDGISNLLNDIENLQRTESRESPLEYLQREYDKKVQIKINELVVVAQRIVAATVSDEGNVDLAKMQGTETATIYANGLKELAELLMQTPELGKRYSFEQQSLEDVSNFEISQKNIEAVLPMFIGLAHGLVTSVLSDPEDIEFNLSNFHELIASGDIDEMIASVEAQQRLSPQPSTSSYVPEKNDSATSNVIEKVLLQDVINKEQIRVLLTQLNNGGMGLTEEAGYWPLTANQKNVYVLKNGENEIGRFDIDGGNDELIKATEVLKKACTIYNINIPFEFEYFTQDSTTITEKQLKALISVLQEHGITVLQNSGTPEKQTNEYILKNGENEIGRFDLFGLGRDGYNAAAIVMKDACKECGLILPGSDLSAAHAATIAAGAAPESSSSDKEIPEFKLINGRNQGEIILQFADGVNENEALGVLQALNDLRKPPPLSQGSPPKSFVLEVRPDHGFNIHIGNELKALITTPPQERHADLKKSLAAKLEQLNSESLGGGEPTPDTDPSDKIFFKIVTVNGKQFVRIHSLLGYENVAGTSANHVQAIAIMMGSNGTPANVYLVKELGVLDIQLSNPEVIKNLKKIGGKTLVQVGPDVDLTTGKMALNAPASAVPLRTLNGAIPTVSPRGFFNANKRTFTSNSAVLTPVPESPQNRSQEPPPEPVSQTPIQPQLPVQRRTTITAASTANQHKSKEPQPLLQPQHQPLVPSQPHVLKINDDIKPMFQSLAANSNGELTVKNEKNTSILVKNKQSLVTVASENDGTLKSIAISNTSDEHAKQALKTISDSSTQKYRVDSCSSLKTAEDLIKTFGAGKLVFNASYENIPEFKQRLEALIESKPEYADTKIEFKTEGPQPEHNKLGF